MRHRLFASLVALVLFAAAASAQVPTPGGPAPFGGFGPNPGATFTPDGVPTGIDNTNLMIGGVGGSSLSLGAIWRCNTFLPNNGAGTYYASPGRYDPTGLGCPDANYAKWNFDFFVSEAAPGLGFSYALFYDTDPGVGTPLPSLGYFLIPPGGLWGPLPGQAVAGTGQDSWNLGMPFLWGLPAPGFSPPVFGPFDYNAPGEYTFELVQYSAAAAPWTVPISHVGMNVNVTPEPVSLLLLGTGLLAVAGAGIRRRKQRDV